MGKSANMHGKGFISLIITPLKKIRLKKLGGNGILNGF